LRRLVNCFGQRRVLPKPHVIRLVAAGKPDRLGVLDLVDQSRIGRRASRFCRSTVSADCRPPKAHDVLVESQGSEARRDSISPPRRVDHPAKGFIDVAPPPIRTIPGFVTRTLSCMLPIRHERNASVSICKSPARWRLQAPAAQRRRRDNRGCAPHRSCRWQSQRIPGRTPPRAAIEALRPEKCCPGFQVCH